MLNKIMTNIKHIGIVLILLLGIVACEKDFEDIAIDLVNNNKFSVGDTAIEIIAYNVEVEKNRVDNNDFNKQPLSLLGVNNNTDFGYLKATLISQLSLPTNGVDFGTNPIIDLVVLDIPYLIKDTIVIKEITTDNDTIYEKIKSLDSIYGNRNLEYDITVNELGTFLNVLDPLNPTKKQEYFSDREYQLKDQIYIDSFKPNVNDTVLYVERKYLNDDSNDVDDIDTIKASDLSPSIKLILNSDFFKTRFVDQDDSSDFENNDNFRQYFRGLYVDAHGNDGSLMNLNTSKSKMTIYYTNNVTKNEGADEDLNGNGINGEKNVIVPVDEADDEDLNFNGIKGEDNVIVKEKQTMHFSLSGVKSNRYIRDYATGAINNVLLNPDTNTGEEKLYVLGAAGSEVVLDILQEGSNLLNELRSNNWLINDAILTFYINGEQDEVPQQLFLYNYKYGSTVADMTSPLFGPDVFGGRLEYKTVLNKKIPEKYTFRITKYLTEILDPINPKEPSKLALRNFVNTDTPITITDTIVKPYNWIPKGVVLHGNKSLDTDKRIRLEIFYSK